MVVLMALVSLTRTQAQLPIHMVAVREAGSPTGLVSASSSETGSARWRAHRASVSQASVRPSARGAWSAIRLD